MARTAASCFAVAALAAGATSCAAQPEPPPPGAQTVVDNTARTPSPTTLPRSSGRAIDGALTTQEIAVIDPVADVGRWPGQPPPPQPTPPSRPRMAEPVIPPDAREPTAEGLKKAMLFYMINAEYHMYTTGDSRFFESYCPKGLPYCKGSRETNSSLIKYGEFILTPATTCIRVTTAITSTNPLRGLYEAACEYKSGNAYNSQFEAVQQLAVEPFRVRAELEHDERIWFLRMVETREVKS